MKAIAAPEARQSSVWRGSVAIATALAGAAAWLSGGGEPWLPPGQAPAAAAVLGTVPLEPETQRLLSLLRGAEGEGLDRGRYPVALIERDLARRSDGQALARGGRLLSAATLAYARDLRVPKSTANVTYIDRALAPKPAPAAELFAADAPSEELRGLQRLNPVYAGLRAGLAWYRSRWSRLPQIQIPVGGALRLGSSGERVALLRRRLGLSAAAGRDHFDDRLGEAVREFRKVHGLADEAVADRETIRALNAGAAHYERLIAANMDRARGLPVDGRQHIVVDSAGAKLWMIEDGRPVGAMRVIVGKPAMATPELVGFIRFAVLNPYWNIPPDLVRHSIAPEVLREGPDRLAARRLALFSDWRRSARSVQPEEVDWSAVAAGREKVWVRQLPGGDNVMGAVKFMLPNRLGIYLHDTPKRSDFALRDRHLSSGCVRVEDAPRLARWIFGGRQIIDAAAGPERRVDLPDPVPVYITYLTAVPAAGEVRFQKDVYNRDPALLALLAATGPHRQT